MYTTMIIWFRVHHNVSHHLSYTILLIKMIGQKHWESDCKATLSARWLALMQSLSIGGSLLCFGLKCLNIYVCDGLALTSVHTTHPLTFIIGQDVMSWEIKNKMPAKLMTVPWWYFANLLITRSHANMLNTSALSLKFPSSSLLRHLHRCIL